MIVMAQVDLVESRLSTHEAVCAERYTGINARLKRLEQILLAATGAIIMLLISVVINIQ